jgi:hypothetical protein
MTCPVVFASFHFHFGIKLYRVLLANAATYGLFGLAVESLRQQLNHAKYFKVAQCPVVLHMWGTSGTRSTPGVSAQRAFISGP